MFQLLQIGSARGPKTADLVSTIYILGIALFIALLVYILKPKFRPIVKVILFTTIMAVLIFLFTYMVVRNKEQQLIEEKNNEYTLP